MGKIILMNLLAGNHLKKIFLVLLSGYISLTGFAFHKISLRLLSPDKRILYEFEIRNGLPGYSVSYQGKLLVDFSVMNLVFDEDSLIQGVRLEESVRVDSVERYSLLTGRSSLVNDAYRQLTLYV